MTIDFFEHDDPTAVPIMSRSTEPSLFLRDNSSYFEFFPQHKTGGQDRIPQLVLIEDPVIPKSAGAGLLNQADNQLFLSVRDRQQNTSPANGLPALQLNNSTADKTSNACKHVLPLSWKEPLLTATAPRESPFGVGYKDINILVTRDEKMPKICWDRLLSNEKPLPTGIPPRESPFGVGHKDIYICVTRDEKVPKVCWNGILSNEKPLYTGVSLQELLADLFKYNKDILDWSANNARPVMRLNNQRFRRNSYLE